MGPRQIELAPASSLYVEYVCYQEGQDHNYGDQILSQDKPAPTIFCWL